MMMHEPARISVELNMRAANVERSPSWEKLLRYQYGSSVVMPAVATPETTKNGNRPAMVLAFIISACTKVMYPTTPANAAQTLEMYPEKMALPIMSLATPTSANDDRKMVAAYTTDRDAISKTRRIGANQPCLRFRERDLRP